MNLKEIGKRIQDRRIYLGKKQADVAEAIGTSRSNYARYEAGDVDLNVTTLEALCKALSVPMSYFVPTFDEWVSEGTTAEFFTGVAPEGIKTLEMIRDAMREKARQEPVIGRKAE
jgi:transcriptional regulator with XRE-family HTH domain